MIYTKLFIEIVTHIYENNRVAYNTQVLSYIINYLDLVAIHIYLTLALIDDPSKYKHFSC